MTYTPDEGMTKKQIEKEVQRQGVLFEEKCKHGSVAHDNRMKFADFVPIYLDSAKLILKLGDAYKNDGWVFTQSDGSPMYPTTPTQWFSRFQTRHNLPHRKFHALRHTCATLLLSNGTNIKNVATRLGHSQLKTTNRYVHAVEQAERESANLLENILNKKSQHTA